MRFALAILATTLLALPLAASELTEAANYDAVQKIIDDSHSPIRVVNLWATWCGPCVAEMSDLARMAKQFPRVTFIGVSLDDAVPGDSAETKKKVAQFLRDRGVTYRNLYFTGRQSELAEKMNFEGGLPVTFVFDRNGKELSRVVGQLSYAKFTKELTQLQRREKR